MITFFNRLYSTPLHTPTGEEALFLHLLRTDWDEAARTKLETLLEPPLDWARVISLTETHRTAPLVHASLTPYYEDRVPAEAAVKIALMARRDSQNTIGQMAELSRLARELNGAKIAWVMLKGPVIGMKLYNGNVQIRPFVDLDILVKTHDLSRARHLLEGRGYQLHLAFRPLPNFARDFGRDYNFEYDHPKQRVRIELHWAAANPQNLLSIDLQTLWTRAETMSLGGLTMLMLPTEELILMLASHGVRHRWSRLKWLVDIAQFMRANPDYDWAGLIDQAAKLRVKRMLLQALWFAHRLLGAPLPPAAAELIRKDPVIERLTDFLQAYIFRGHTSSIEMLKLIFSNMDVRDSRIDKFRFVVQYFAMQVSMRHTEFGYRVGVVALFFLWMLYKPLAMLEKRRA